MIPLEEEMETHSSILAWKKISWTESLAGYSPWGPKKLDTTHWPNYINSVYVSTSDSQFTPTFSLW